jgi:hypothetical protein
MPLTDTQRAVLMELHRYKTGRPFREDHEKAAIDEMCRMIPPLVCDPHTMQNSLFTMITDEGRTALLDDPIAVERMPDRIGGVINWGGEATRD